MKWARPVPYLRPQWVRKKASERWERPQGESGPPGMIAPPPGRGGEKKKKGGGRRGRIGGKEEGYNNDNNNEIIREIAIMVGNNSKGSDRERGEKRGGRGKGESQAVRAGWGHPIGRRKTKQ